MDFSRLRSKEDVEKLSYVDFISLLQETNRCPGGKDTIRKIVRNVFLDRSSRVLDVGSNTGFTSLELARVAHCHVVGIDVVESAIAESRRVLSLDTDEIQKLVSFEKASATDIPFPSEKFDLVVAGGATSFMDEKKKAIQEYFRVLKPWGFLSITNLFYHTTPPESVVEKVSKVIGVRINPWSSQDWMRIFVESSR